ncbi:hypothetical protein CLU79DRAFT_778320 [Phycomyces nitens]|nr:hypothetical protein CLU79DRAFT_778320 [Phycomyces nitens]
MSNQKLMRLTMMKTTGITLQLTVIHFQVLRPSFCLFSWMVITTCFSQKTMEKILTAMNMICNMQKAAVETSDYVKNSMADPRKSKFVASLPDRTLNQSVCLQQGEKWRVDPYFQQPIYRIDNSDYWSGDIVCLSDKDPLKHRYLVQSFHTVGKAIIARGHQLTLFKDGTRDILCIEIACRDIPINRLQSIDTRFIQKYQDCNIYSLHQGSVVTLYACHASLLFGTHRLKRKVPGQNKFYQVKVAPIILFSYDTSGNRSKQFNPYESWSMKFAALSFSDRQSIENIHFLSAIPKKYGASGVSLLPGIVDNLVQLENGIVTYSCEENMDVLVVAPLLWIEADTPCHSQLCGLYAPGTLYPCRKCYVLLKRGENNFDDLSYYLRSNLERTRDHYVLANSGPRSQVRMPPLPTLGDNLVADDLSFKDCSSGDLLWLKAFDPSKDTPVEILHTILLGTAKYLVDCLVKVLLKGKTNIFDKLNRILIDYKNSTKLSRKFAQILNHCGSFLGRDYKVLVQILPNILVTYFAECTSTQPIILSFCALGPLCSLVFVRQVTYGFEQYIGDVDSAVKHLLTKLHEFDIKNLRPGFLIQLPKVHNLLHLPQDIRRFETALNFETEKGEQFNKHIRESLFHTNRTNTSRDIALRFGRKAVLQHVMDGGS